MLTGNRILIVDDDENLRFTLSEILKKDGHKITIAKDAYEAIEWSEKEDFSLIIMDIKMPKKSGLEAISDIIRIRPNTPIILLTAYGE